MLKNYLKTALRNLTRNRMHSTINIVGLSCGMAVALLIGLWIWDEVSFDRATEHYDRIAQVVQNVSNNGEVQTKRSLPYPLAEVLRREYGQDFSSVVLGADAHSGFLTLGDKSLAFDGGFFESAFPDMLGLHMLEGTRSALSDQTSILLAASVAKAFFGDKEPMGQMLKINNQWSVKVAGVYEDLPLNSSFHDLHFIAPWALYVQNTEWIRTIQEPWRPNAFSIYVQVQANADMDKVSAQIRDAKARHLSGQLAQKKPVLFLQPMRQWHLYEDFKDGLNIGGRIQYVWLFGIVGVFVLLMACINFMNLSTARSEKRAKEVGIRKTLGSARGQLISLFLGESLLLAILSFAVSLALVWLALPFFNEVAGKQMSIPWTQSFFWIAAIAFTLLTGLIAGSYPALYLSSFRPVKVLKGIFKAGPSAAVPRRALVVLQFSISVVLVIGTIVVFQQIQYTKNRPIGFENNGLVSALVNSARIHTHFEAVKTDLLQAGAITSMAEGGNSTTEGWNSTSALTWPGKDPNLSTDFPVVAVSHDYGKTVGWTVSRGRSFSREFASDSAAMLINESAARFMGLQHPVGQVVHWYGSPFTIVGVVQDMVLESPYNEVRPSIFVLDTGSESFILMKINPAQSTSAALGAIEKVFKQYDPADPFTYRFEDEEYARKFGNEERIGKLGGLFALLAILISCLGIFGLSAFMAEQRVKEIGVRKILGASVYQCWRLLSKDFVVLIVVSLLVAGPVAWYAMNRWLSHYRYHTGISWWVFAASGLGAVVITLGTVSYQSIRAALMSPVRSLRTE